MIKIGKDFGLVQTFLWISIGIVSKSCCLTNFQAPVWSIVLSKTRVSSTVRSMFSNNMVLLETLQPSEVVVLITLPTHLPRISTGKRKFAKNG